MKRLLITVAVVLNLVLADAVVKELACGMLGPAAESGPHAVCVIPGLFNLAYVENRGCAWGMFQGSVWPLAVFGTAALALLVWKRRSFFGPGRLAAVAEPGELCHKTSLDPNVVLEEILMRLENAL